MSVVAEAPDGRITRLRKDAGSRAEVTRRLREFPGVGPTAARIFLRNMGPIWDV